MSTPVFILGESGTGKTASLRNLNPSDTLLIQAVQKPLPFRNSEWKLASKENPSGSIFPTDNAQTIIKAMQRTEKSVIVIDDFQYIMANEFMRRSGERGFDKFTDIGRNVWDIVTAASNLGANKRVYMLAHVEQNDIGKTKIKTIGKMIDEKITLEGMVTMVLRTQVSDGSYMFTTKNNGSDTVKTPMEMFNSDTIENDLKMVDDTIIDYYNLNQSN